MRERYLFIKPRPALWPRLLLGLVVLLVAGVLGLYGWLRWALDLNDFKQDLQTELLAETGLTLHLDGELSHGLGRALVVETGPFRITKGERLLVDAGNAEMALALEPLLDQRVVLTGLRLDLNSLTLPRQANGDFDLIKTTDAPTADDPARGNAFQFAIEQALVTLIHGQVLDAQGKPDLAFDQLRLEIANLHPDLGQFDPFSDLIAGDWSGQLRIGQLRRGGLRLAELRLEAAQALRTPKIDLGTLMYQTSEGEQISAKDLSAELVLNGNDSELTIDADLASHAAELLGFASQDYRLDQIKTSGEIRLPRPLPELGLPKLTVRARLQAASLARGEQNLAAVQTEVELSQAMLRMNSLRTEVGGKPLNGSGQVDFNEPDRPWQFRLGGQNLDVEQLFGLIDTDMPISGRIDLNVELAGRRGADPLRALNGDIALHGQDIVVQGIDLEQTLTHFEDSQSVGLLDLGAYAIAGPVGPLLTKTKDYGQLLRSVKRGGDSHIRTAHSKSRLQDGVLKLNDVAFATDQHRVALQGAIDLAGERFQAFSIATVDEYGCPIYRESLSGSLDDPQVKKENLLVKSVINPVKSLISQATDLVHSGCEEPFYSGQVAHPPKARRKNIVKDAARPAKEVSTGLLERIGKGLGGDSEQPAAEETTNNWQEWVD